MLPYIPDPYIHFRARHQVASKAATGFEVSRHWSEFHLPCLAGSACLGAANVASSQRDFLMRDLGFSDAGFGLVDVILTIFMLFVFFETIYEIGCPTVLASYSCYKPLT